MRDDDHPTLVPAQEQDRNDGKLWSPDDIEDLTLALKDGARLRVPRTPMPGRHYRGRSSEGERPRLGVGPLMRDHFSRIKL